MAYSVTRGWRRATTLFAMVLLMTAMGGGVHLFLQLPIAPTNPSPAKRTNSGYRFARPELELIDFRYEGRWEGLKFFSLNAEKLTVQKKRLGFFRFGLLREVVIEQAIIELTFMAHGSFLPDKKPWSVEALLPGSKALGLTCAPVSLTANQPGHDGASAQIHADSAEIRDGGRLIRFRGRVRLVAGEAALESSELELYPGGKQITVQRAYTLVTKRGRESGRGLRSDIFLRSCSVTDNNK